MVALIDERKTAGEPIDAEQRALSEAVAAELIPDWRTTLDALHDVESVRTSHPVGYYGLSQGGEMGIRLVADEPRIAAAVLGLIGSDWLIGPAARITVPVEFLLHWDDEGNPRASVAKLFEALGSSEKSLHANPGSHFRVPSFEIDSAIRFFARHLGDATGS